MMSGIPPMAPVLVAPVLVALGFGVLLWSPPRAWQRLQIVVGRPRVTRSSNRMAFLAAGAPVAALVLGGLSAAVAAGIVVALVMWIRRRRQAEKRFDRRLDDLLLALSLMISELSVGAPPVHACEVAVAELRRRTADGGRGCSEIADGLEAMASRASLGGSAIADPEPTPGSEDASGAASWHRIGVAWQTAEQYGLPMVDTLAALRSDLRSRRGFADRTRAGLSGPRATAMVLAGLPLLGIALGQATGAGPIQVLLGGGLGGVLLMVGTVLAAAGVAWSERITGKVLAR
ncbi:MULTISPECIES: type II secretion system F family protein [Gordonia]|jgi:tight adherence protein B|uniref:Type II secretion system protein F n=1 Tax=Gordonia alkanivorans CGMCC 6845 TaxID=1423140 RepID=W9DEZ2_9ACTN|nr:MULTISPECIES: type II secretion system protein F [Gordonia]ETA07032.1 type II secretion system protein F [Gordonia alkanivorans CGMCC 6845]MDH3007129.1 type II secretion system protein F [Gordonia alkanivorans]MDH3013676.1 type II secretion system protein F [Gordonia alkanivorans]MDH3017068.1 type II secretion system protein F [Gordonia alkanivorans]MDH3021584.1 type II secretion system protein F [Gordonia alkanivorans]